MPNTEGVLLGPGPLAIAVTRPYSATYLWQNGNFCARDGKIYKFIGTDLIEGEAWTPAHWSEVKLTDEIMGLQTQIDALDPEAATGLFTDVAFTINSNQWTTGNNVWTFNLSNALIKSTSGIAVYYDNSFRTALAGDIDVAKAKGYVTFSTNGQPQGALSGTLRIIDSVSGVLPVNKGGTGAATAKAARNNLNVSIKPIPVSFTSVSSLPQTYYDTDITAEMVPTNWLVSNPASCPTGLTLTVAAGSVTVKVTGTQTFSGETNISFYLENPRTHADDASGQQSEQYVGDFVQIGAQSLTTQQQQQARTNIGAQPVTDSTLATTSKTVPGAINELNSNITTINSKIVVQDVTSQITFTSGIKHDEFKAFKIGNIVVFSGYIANWNPSDMAADTIVLTLPSTLLPIAQQRAYSYSDSINTGTLILKTNGELQCGFKLVAYKYIPVGMIYVL